MDIRKAKYDDLPRILEIYENARAFMVQNGNPTQWGSLGWPPETLVRQDIATGRGYVCEDAGQIVGVFYFEHGHRIDPTYHSIDGAWIGNEYYGVVHRIASCRKGVGSFCINWAYRQCGHLRIDTHEANIPMRNLLTKLGFQYCGIIYVQVDSSARLAYEKVSPLPDLVHITVDRPLGSRHPKHPDIVYPVNYGFVPGVMAPDGAEQDAYVLGVHQPVAQFAGVHIATIHRKNDVEDKWVIAPEGMHFTAEEIRQATHFQEQYFDTELWLL